MYYLSLAIMALGGLSLGTGLACAIAWQAARRRPPRSEAEEERRRRIGTVGASLLVVGLLLIGVGVLFR